MTTIQICYQQVRDSLKWYAVLEILFTLPGIPQHRRTVLPSCRIQVYLYMAYPGMEI